MLKVRSRPGLLARSGGSARAIAAALPATNSAGGVEFASTGSPTRIDADTSTTITMPNGIALPAGDWSVGMYVFIPTNTNTGNQAILSCATSSSNPYSANGTFNILYRTADGRISVQGVDGSGNSLGQQTCPLPASNTNSNSLITQYPLLPGRGAFIFVVKTGSFAQLWMKFDGHAPVLCSEAFTSFGAITSTFFLGLGRDSSNAFKGTVRQFFKLSYALTKDQMDQIGNGATPTDFGTEAGDDFYFTMAATAATFTSTINGCELNRTFNNSTTSAGVGYAAQTEAVFLDPIGADGFVVNQYDGSATVSLSGTYRGAHGGDIQVQFLDYNNAAFRGWQTVATSISGNTWSGSVILPKGKRWIKAQIRKLISGVPSTDVITTTLRWGIGMNVCLIGQSLMEHSGETAVVTTYNLTARPNYGSSTVTPNGFVSQHRDFPGNVTYSNRKQFAVTGAANNGSGLIRITASGRHGLKQNERVQIRGVTGTTEANGEWVVNVISRTQFDLQGSTFANAWISGGQVYTWKSAHVVFDPTWEVAPDGHVLIGNAISNIADCVVCISNQAVGGQAIEQFNDLNKATGINIYGATSMLAARSVGGFNLVLWLHGHQNLGQTAYFMDSGTWYSETGYGEMGKLLDLYRNTMVNGSSAMFGVAGFHSITGRTSATPATVHNFRWGFNRFVSRKNTDGDSRVFYTGDFLDLENQWENGLVQLGHLTPVQKGYPSQYARLGNASGYALLGSLSRARGPAVASVTRSGANLDVTVTHTGGSDITWDRRTDGSIPSGFEVATDTAFTSLLTISNITKLSSTNFRITLSADPGATVYVRYLNGLAGQTAANVYNIPRISGVADNGAGLIRVTCAIDMTPATPQFSQKNNSGHGLTTGQWTRVVGVKGATQANGVWQVTRINDTQFDLVGSSSAGLGTFVANENLWATSATGVVSVECGIPIYDDQIVGGWDTLGLPLQPTENYLTAT